MEVQVAMHKYATGWSKQDYREFSKVFSRDKIMWNSLVLTLVHAAVITLPNVTVSSVLDLSQLNYTWDESGPIFLSEFEQDYLFYTDECYPGIMMQKILREDSQLYVDT